MLYKQGDREEKKKNKVGGKKRKKEKHNFKFIACKNKFISRGKKDLRASRVEQPSQWQLTVNGSNEKHGGMHARQKDIFLRL